MLLLSTAYYFEYFVQIKLEEQKKKLEEVALERDELKTELKKAALDLEQLIRDKVRTANVMLSFI